MTEFSETAICKNCGSNERKIELTPYSIHYAKIWCKKCGRFMGFQPNPKNEGKRNGTSRYAMGDVLKYREMKQPRCFFCLRTQEQLGMKQVLTIDHIFELSKDGVDELFNLQILCTACHKLKNWMRLYHNWHYHDSTTTQE